MNDTENLHQLPNPYSLDLAKIFNRGWTSFAQALGMLVAVTLVGAIISIPIGGVYVLLSLIPIIGPLLGMVVNSAVGLPLWSGLIVISLAQIRGQPWAFSDLFGGFRYWKALFVFGLIAGSISWACMLPANICSFLAGGSPINYLLQGDFSKPPPQPQPVLNLLAQFLNLAGVVILLFITVRYFALSPYLIIDRNHGAIDAIKANAVLTQGHFFGWLGLILLFGLIAGAGFLVCCVGVVVTIPLYYLLMTSAYLEATGARQSSTDIKLL